MDIKQFDIIYISLTKNGSVQNGKRPAIVIQNNMGNMNSPTCLVIPFTKQIKKVNIPTHHVIKKTLTNGLSVDSMLLAEQTTSVDAEQILGKVGHIDDYNDQEKIINCYMANVIGYVNENYNARKIISMILNCIGGRKDGDNKRRTA